MGMIRSIRRSMMREALQASGKRGINKKHYFRGEDNARSTFSKAWHEYTGRVKKAEKMKQKAYMRLIRRRRKEA